MPASAPAEKRTVPPTFTSSSRNDNNNNNGSSSTSTTHLSTSDQLQRILDLSHPSDVLHTVVRYLANHKSLSGSPLQMIQVEYTRFIESQQTLTRELASAADRTRAANVLRADEGGTEAVYVMDNAKSSLRDVHSELRVMHEQYRKAVRDNITKDRSIAQLQQDLARANESLDILQRGITSTHVVHASTVEDSDLLREAQILNGKMAETIAAFEDMYDVGAYVDVNEMMATIQELRDEKESLVVHNGVFAQHLLESDERILSLQNELSVKTSAIDNQKAMIEKLQREVALLKDEMVHMQGVIR